MNGYARENLHPSFQTIYDAGSALRVFSDALNKIAQTDRRSRSRHGFVRLMGRAGRLVFASQHDCLVFYCEDKAVADFLEATLDKFGYPGNIAQTLVGSISNPGDHTLVVYSLKGCDLGEFTAPQAEATV